MFTYKISKMQRPWNLPSLPVYSLATYAEGRVNMNICTYVTAVSLKPKKMAVAVYQGSRTLTNLNDTQPVVLQLSGQSQHGLVRHLGKKSGNDWDKDTWLKKRELTHLWHGYPVLKECAACIEMIISDKMDAGDHTLFVFDVKKAASFHTEILTTTLLGDLKIIRI